MINLQLKLHVSLRAALSSVSCIRRAILVLGVLFCSLSVSVQTPDDCIPKAECTNLSISLTSWCALQECLVLFKGPSDVAVEEVHAILRHIVARTLEGEECKGLAQYGQLKREIATCAAAALESMKDDARKMVLTMVRRTRFLLLGVIGTATSLKEPST